MKRSTFIKGLGFALIVGYLGGHLLAARQDIGKLQDGLEELAVEVESIASGQPAVSSADVVEIDGVLFYKQVDGSFMADDNF